REYIQVPVSAPPQPPRTPLQPRAGGGAHVEVDDHPHLSPFHPSSQPRHVATSGRSDVGAAALRLAADTSEGLARPMVTSWAGSVVGDEAQVVEDECVG